MDGTDSTEQLTRDIDFVTFMKIFPKDGQRIYIPIISSNKMTRNQDPSMIRTRLRLLNRFYLNISNIECLYKAEERNIIISNIPDVANAK